MKKGQIMQADGKLAMLFGQPQTGRICVVYESVKEGLLAAVANRIDLTPNLLLPFKILDKKASP